MVEILKDDSGFITEIVVGDVRANNLIVVDFSETQTFLRCQRRHHYKYSLNLQKKKKSIPMKKGTVLHNCLENYYKTGDWKPTWREYCREFAKLFEEEREHYGNLPLEVKRIMRGYVSHYKKRDGWKVLGAEVKFAVRVKGTNIVIRGKIDLIVEDDAGIWVVDHKSAQSLPDNDYRMSEVQLTLYYWAIGKVFGEKACGVIYNYLRTKAPTAPRKLKNGSMSLAKIETDYCTVKKFILSNEMDPADYQEYLLKLKKTSASKWFSRFRVPRNKKTVKDILHQTLMTALAIQEAKKIGTTRCIIKQCGWDCDYIDLCHADLQGLDTDFLIKKVYETRDSREDVFGVQEKQEI